MKGSYRKFHEVIIRDDPEQRRRVAMEQNGQFYVMVIEKENHGAEFFEKKRLRILENPER